jgi:hypothetical protein
VLRVSAFILLLATLGFLTETVQMPFVMARMAEKSACCGGMQCKEMGQPGKDGRHGQDGKCNPDGSCNNTANCNNCPMCYTATPAAVYSLSFDYTLRSTHYPVLSAGKLADYHSRSWKPPNAGSSLPDRI